MSASDRFFCTACDGQGWKPCCCGGDLCVCENGGEIECHVCGGEGQDDDEPEFDIPERP